MTDSAKAKKRLPLGDALHRDFKIAVIQANKTLFDATQEAIRQWVDKQTPRKKRS